LPFKRPFGAFLNYFHLKKLINVIKPDLLHVFEASQAGLLGRLINFKPSILSVYGSDVFDFPYKSFVHKHIIKKNLEHYNWICSTSNMMVKQVLKLSPNLKNISTTPFGVDTSVFQRSRSSNNNYITIGTVKTLRYKYGIDILIKAFATCYSLVLNIQPSLASKLRLMIVGDGTQLADLKQLALSLGISDKVDFVGYVKNKNVPDLLNEMDIFVALSRMKSETFGVAIVEASSFGLPVVVSNIGGLPEVVINNHTGLIVESENVEMASEAILKLVLDENIRKQYGINGRDFVRNKYEWNNCVNVMLNVHEKVTNNIIV
jgi:glycosyltransferase involved in cell wall biosynthesis